MQVDLFISTADEFFFFFIKILPAPGSTSGNIDSIILRLGLLYGSSSQNKKDSISVRRIINLTKKIKKRTHQMLLDEISQRR